MLYECRRDTALMNCSFRRASLMAKTNSLDSVHVSEYGRTYMRIFRGKCYHFPGELKERLLI